MGQHERTSLRNQVRLQWHGGRPRLRPPEYFDRFELEVDGNIRTYWLPAANREAAPAGAGPRPLIVALHGLNSSGSRLAWWSGLDPRGPAAGFTCVFPDARDTVWDDHGCGRRDGADDVAFVVALVEHLAATGVADPDRVVMTGVSSGATFAERIVRTGAVRARGMALIVGTARLASRSTTAIAADPTRVMLVAGTGDPLLPWDGGPSRGPMAKPTMRAVVQALNDASGHDFVAPVELATEWAAVNGCSLNPETELLAPTGDGFAVDALRWTRPADGSPGVTLYRIAGGGHGWPGGRQYLPVRCLGRIPQHWDATGIVLDFARDVLNLGTGQAVA